MRTLLNRWLAVGVIVACATAPPSAFAAAQLKAGAATSAQPSAPKGTSLRQIQINFDPATFAAAAPGNTIDFTRAVTAYQLTVGYNSNQVSVVNTDAPDYSGTNFGPPPMFSESFYPALYGPYSPFSEGTFEGAAFTPSPLTTGIPTGFDTFITAGGQLVGPLVPGDVNIFSLLFDVNPGVADTDLVNFAIFASPHDTDGTPLNPDFITSTSLTDPSDQVYNPPGMVETTIIGASLSGDFVTLAGNSALTPSVVVPLPSAAAAGLAGLAGAAACGVRLRRKARTI